MLRNVTGLLITSGRSDLLLGNQEVVRGYRFPVTILDGSPLPEAEVVAAFRPTATLRYLHLPEASLCDRLLTGARECDSEFVVALSDDDRFLHGCIEKCVGFLEQSPDFAAAQGSFWHRGQGRTASRWSRYTLEDYAPSLLDERPEERVARHCTSFAHTFYAVHRRDMFVRSVENTRHVENDGAFAELAQSLSAVAAGKMKRFSSVYCVRAPNSPGAQASKYRFDVGRWLELDRTGYAEALERFVTVCGRLPPFADLWGGRGVSFLSEMMMRYVAAERTTGGALHRRYKYVLRWIDRAWAGWDSLAVVARISESLAGRLALAAANDALSRIGPVWWS